MLKRVAWTVFAFALPCWLVVEEVGSPEPDRWVLGGAAVWTMFALRFVQGLWGVLPGTRQTRRLIAGWLRRDGVESSAARVVERELASKVVQESVTQASTAFGDDLLRDASRGVDRHSGYLASLRAELVTDEEILGWYAHSRLEREALRQYLGWQRLTTWVEQMKRGLTSEEAAVQVHSMHLGFGDPRKEVEVGPRSLPWELFDRAFAAHRELAIEYGSGLTAAAEDAGGLNELVRQRLAHG